LENRLFSTQWQVGRKPLERRALFSSKRGRMPQGYLEICIDIVPESKASETPLDYLLKPPTRVPWEMRVILWKTRGVTPKKIYHADDECCCCDICLPPNQSDVKLVAGLTGSTQKPSATDVHLRCIDGEALFNWRTIQNIDLPAPEPFCNLKVQVWNVNWNPDDCIAEAVIPLWGFMEYARRNLNPENHFSFKIPKQFVLMTHPHTTDKGEVEMEIELLPKEIARKSAQIAAPGFDGFKMSMNSSTNKLDPPVRPPSSFPWYRLDQQIIWRVSYCCGRVKWYLLLLALAAVLVIGLYFGIKK